MYTQRQLMTTLKTISPNTRLNRAQRINLVGYFQSVSDSELDSEKTDSKYPAWNCFFPYCCLAIHLTCVVVKYEKMVKTFRP